MKTVSATVIYKDNRIYSLSVDHKGKLTSLIWHPVFNDSVLPYQRENFNEMYYFVLCLLKINGYKCNYYEEFGARWYNIQWIDLDCPRPQKYGFVHEKGEK